MHVIHHTCEIHIVTFLCSAQEDCARTRKGDFTKERKGKGEETGGEGSGELLRFLKVGMRRMRMTGREHAMQADAGDYERNSHPGHDGDALVVDEALQEEEEEERRKRGGGVKTREREEERRQEAREGRRGEKKSFKSVHERWVLICPDLQEGCD